MFRGLNPSSFVVYVFIITPTKGSVMPNSVYKLLQTLKPLEPSGFWHDCTFLDTYKGNTFTNKYPL